MRILNLLISLDQFLFSLITLGGAYPDETMSSAAFRMERDGKFFGFFRPVIDFLFVFIQDAHCKKAYESEKMRLQAPK